MKKIIALLFVLCSLCCGSAWADLHIGESHGLANGVIYDLLWHTWAFWDKDYAVEGPLSLDGPPVYGDLYFYSETAGEEFHVASEVGVSEGGIYYTKAHAEASAPWIEGGPYCNHSWSGGSGNIIFTTDIGDGPLALHWIEEGFQEYENVGWQIQLVSLNYSSEGAWQSLVYQTDFDKELFSEGIQLIDLPLADAYQLSWSMGIFSLTPGDHGWAQLSLDLAIVPLPSAVILSILGISMAGMKLRKETKE